MKQLLGYLSWLFTGLALWQWGFITSIALQISSVLVANPLGLYLQSAGFFILLATLFKWAVWDSIRNSWQRYCAERDRLFTTIRDSDNHSS